jgi:Zn-dependent protease
MAEEDFGFGSGVRRAMSILMRLSESVSRSAIELTDPDPNSASGIIYHLSWPPRTFLGDCPRWASSSPGDDRVTTLQQFLLVAPMLLFSMVAHEYAHGYAAFREGDDTAFMLGRLTWNPLRHIDPWMTVILPVLMFFTLGFAFGGAKPVPVNPRKYRHFKRGDIIVSLAGIATNLVIAALLVPVVIGLGLLGRLLPVLSDTISIVQLMFIFGVTINLILAGFNLMPVPPLDGSHVMKYLMPVRWAVVYQRVARFGFLLLMLLISFGRPVLSAWMAPVFALNRMALAFLSPFVLPSPWTT